MYIFPRTRFVDSVLIEDQLKHLASEIVEARVAYTTPYIVRLAEELFDVIHSSETALRILEEKCGCDASMPSTTRFNRTSALPLYSQVRRLSACLDLVCQEFLTGSEVRTAIALFSVISTAEAALVTLGTVYSVGIATVRRDVERKNEERGYYASTNLAQRDRLEEAHSGSEGRALPASPSCHQEKEIPANGPMENAP